MTQPKPEKNSPAKTPPDIKDPPGPEQPKAPVLEPGEGEPMLTRPPRELHPGGVEKADHKPERVAHDIAGDLKPPKE
jgi:hypothetical protein